MLNWEEILDEIVDGYDAAIPYIDAPGFTHADIVQIKSRIKDHKRDLKKVIDDSKIKQFFKENIISQENVDEFSKKLGKPILIDRFDPERLRPANYDLRLGDEVYVTAEKLPRKLTETQDTIAIQPGEFGILMTYEYVHVPLNRLGLISLRFKYKTQGLVNISGFHVDPGFTGKIIFSVFNTGPRSVVLRFKEPVFMIMFEELNEIEAKSGYGTGGFSQQKHLPVDIMTSLGGESVSVIKLDRRLRKLETQLRILEALLIGLTLAILPYIASRVWHVLFP
jgi:dCTP deaminase